jgi:hypothetical protein
MPEPMDGAHALANLQAELAQLQEDYGNLLHDRDRWRARAQEAEDAVMMLHGILRTPPGGDVLQHARRLWHKAHPDGQY